MHLKANLVFFFRTANETKRVLGTKDNVSAESISTCFCRKYCSKNIYTKSRKVLWDGGGAEDESGWVLGLRRR